jgi:hypothetical protein
MLTSYPRPRRSRVEQMVTLLVATCLTLLAVSAGSAAHAVQPTATISSAALHNAIAARTAASHTLTKNSSKLSACLHSHPRRCAAERLAVKHSRAKLKGIDRQLTDLSASVARRRNSTTPTLTPTTTQTQGPTLTVSGSTISWQGVSGVSSYDFVRKVPGQEDQYSVVTGTSITPPAVPGATVRYSLRTNVSGSPWAPEVTISYPSTATLPVTPAPVITAPVETTPPAKNTPPAEKAPAETTPPVETTPPAEEQSASSFTMGVVAGAELTYERPFIEKLGAHTARMEFGIDTPASQMASTIEAYAKAGIQPLLLAGFSGRIPSSAEAKNIASWAAEFGPGGTLWQGRTFPANTAVTHIEFGNETSYTYQFSNNSTSEYANRAQSYAIRVKEAHEAIQASNPSVGILAQADSGGLSGNEWVANMFKAVPNLGSLVAGWTVHPYGSSWQTRIDQLVAGTNAVGASSSIPIYVTEWGLDTDNGRCLEYNYGWNKCMTYAEASSTLSSTVSAMRSRYGSRLAAVYLYQAHDQQPTGTSTALESYFGALQSNGSAKGAYTTEVESLLSTNP